MDIDMKSIGEALKSASEGLGLKSKDPKKGGQDPNSPDSQKQSDEQLLKELDEKWSTAERVQRDMERLWKENLAFLEGIQMLVSSQSMMVNIQGHTNKGRERLVDNRVLDNARRLHARLDQPSYQPTVIAATDMPGDHELARIANAGLRSIYHKRKFSPQKRQAMWWIVGCGQVYWEVFFDPAAGSKVRQPKVDENGQVVLEDAKNPQTGEPLKNFKNEQDPVTGLPKLVEVPVQMPVYEMKPQGEVDFLFRAPFQVKRDFRFQEFKKLRWSFVEEIAAREEVLDRYADEYDKAHADEPDAKTLDDILEKQHKVQTVNYLPEISPQTVDFTGLPRPVPAVTGVLQVRRYFERPSKKYPKGRHVVYSGKVVLYRGDLDTPDGDLPIISQGYILRPWLMEGKSPVGDVKGLQRIFNTILSRYGDHLRRLPAGWLLVPTTSGIPRKGFTSEAGAIVRYNPAGGKPEFIFPPLANLQVYEKFLSLIVAAIEERMALPPALRGQMPRGAKAAKMVELLQEAADQIQAPVIADIADAFVDFWTKILSLMKRHYNAERLVTMLGEDKKASAYKWVNFPSDWQDRLLIQVESGHTLPSTKLAKMEMILNLARTHLIFGKPGTPDYTRKLRQAIQFDAGFINSDEDLDMAIAEEENLMLVGGQQVQVREIDDHRVHLISHVAHVKQMILAGKEKDAQGLMQHIMAHRQAMQKMMAALAAQNPQAAQKEGAKPGAGAPGAEPQPHPENPTGSS